MATFTFDKADQKNRFARVKQYLTQNVLSDSGGFICRHEQACQSSCNKHGVTFSKGQLHHIGKHYSLQRNGEPFRVAIVGEQYGHGNPKNSDGEEEFTTLHRRYETILGCGDCLPRMSDAFKIGMGQADAGKSALNPHITGTLAALRFLFGKSMKPPYRSEDSQIEINGSSVSIFDCFALTNYLLCSGTKDSAGTKATSVMWRNCLAHISKVLTILQPTHILLQGSGKVFDHIQNATGALKKHAHSKIDIFGIETHIFAFHHPRYNWRDFTDKKHSYLQSTVGAVIKRVVK